MQHTIQQMYDKVCAMRDMAQVAHNMKYARPSADHFDEITMLVEQIQAMAGDIYHDTQMHPKVKEKQEKKAWDEHHPKNYHIPPIVANENLKDLT